MVATKISTGPTCEMSGMTSYVYKTLNATGIWKYFYHAAIHPVYDFPGITNFHKNTVKHRKHIIVSWPNR